MYAPDIDKVYNIQYWKDRTDEAEQKCDSLLRQLKEQRGRLRDEFAMAALTGNLAERIHKDNQQKRAYLYQLFKPKNGKI